MATSIIVLLILCLLLACFFEFINGFHDTANAVATVIYTNSLKPTVAVVYSGILNFLGVTIGIGIFGPAVAMGILNLLPVDILVDANPYHGVALVLALLISAIVWNFGTWYFGIPASSSHTIIGSILGVGLAFYFLSDNVGSSAINWDKAYETGMSLLVSPLAGFSLAIVVMFIFKRLVKNETVYKEPIPGKRPPIWIRMMLWATCGLVSFFHGLNDGQKGIGIIMMILISIMPGQFALDEKVNLQSTNGNILKIESLILKADSTKFGEKEKIAFREILLYSGHFKEAIVGKFSSKEIELTKRFGLRKDLVKITRNTDKLIKGENLSLTLNDQSVLKREVKNAKKIIEYAPSWVTIMISISLGLGTMIGWQRVAKTIGEKIGKQHMSYAQGASAEIVAAIGIAFASWKGAPVSTTHMLSSGIAGSMVAKKGLKNLQKKTIVNILLAWVLTLPVTILLAAGLFIAFHKMFGG